jgi:hypothetical protein
MQLPCGHLVRTIHARAGNGGVRKGSAVFFGRAQSLNLPKANGQSTIVEARVETSPTSRVGRKAEPHAGRRFAGIVRAHGCELLLELQLPLDLDEKCGGRQQGAKRSAAFDPGALKNALDLCGFNRAIRAVDERAIRVAGPDVEREDGMGVHGAAITVGDPQTFRRRGVQRAGRSALDQGTVIMMSNRISA